MQTFHPPHLLFLKSLIRSATRLVTLPTSHPLHKPALNAIRNPVKRHQSPIHLLFITTKVKPLTYETILPARRRRNYRTLANISIEKDRKKAITQAQQTTGTVVYTDGSGYEKGIGVAVIMTKNGWYQRSCRYYLGPESIHTVYEAEALAITLALHLLGNVKVKLKKVTIGTDNQAVLLGLSNQKSKPSHYLIDKIHNLLEDFQVTQARIRGKTTDGYKKGKGRIKQADGSLGWKDWNLKKWCKVDFIWTPGHEGIEGNEKADVAAKEAAKGASDEKEDLPSFLRRKPLPASISATRSILKINMKKRWKGEWKRSSRFNRTHAIDYALPSPNYLHTIDQLTRSQTSLLTQLRTGHNPLNVVLHRMKQADSPECPHCRKGFKESIFDYLITCPHYANARRILQYELGRKASEIPFLIGTNAGIPPLLRFISNTKRLRATFGEVRPDDDFVLTSKKNPLNNSEDP